MSTVVLGCPPGDRSASSLRRSEPVEILDESRYDRPRWSRQGSPRGHDSEYVSSHVSIPVSTNMYNYFYTRIPSIPRIGARTMPTTPLTGSRLRGSTPVCRCRLSPRQPPDTPVAVGRPMHERPIHYNNMGVRRYRAVGSTRVSLRCELVSRYVLLCRTIQCCSVNWNAVGTAFVTRVMSV